MSKNSTFTEDEQFLINQMGKSDPTQIEDPERVAKLLASKIGDMEFNKKLKDDKREGAKALKTFTYKTQDLDIVERSIKKVSLAEKLSNNGMDIANHEKISIKDLGYLYRFNTSMNSGNFGYVYEQVKKDGSRDLQEYSKLYQNIENCSKTIAAIEQSALTNQYYKSGDIIVDQIKERRVLRNQKRGLMDFDGPIGEVLVSPYGHVSTVYADEKRDLLFKSHVISNQKVEKLASEDIIVSKVIRVQPYKLLNEKYIQDIEKVYGKEWEKEIDKIYHTVSTELHSRFHSHIEEINKNSHKSNEILEKIKGIQEQIKTLNKSPSPDKEKIEKLEDKKSELYKSNSEIENKQSKLYSKLIKMDNSRLQSPTYWFSPGSILKGHKTSDKVNDFAKISQDRFNFTEIDREQREQRVCSEEAAINLSSTIYQVNKIVLNRLVQEGISIDQNDEVIKNPFSKHEIIEKIHPGRLISLLKEFSVEVENENLSHYIDRDNYKKSISYDLEKSLSKKIWSMTQKYEDRDKFIEDSKTTMSLYLANEGVDQKQISTQLSQMDQQLGELYDKKNDKSIASKISSLVKGVMVKFGLREKNQSIKEVIEQSKNELKQWQDRVNKSNNVKNSAKVNIGSHRKGNARG